jgi:phosphoribosylglycinamide formyltransferase-1
MSDPKIRIGVLASGRGSNLQAIMDACESGSLKALVAVVVSDRRDAQALERARRHRLTAVFLNPKDSPTREDYDERVVEILKQQAVDLVILAGYMRIVTTRLISAYPNRIMNIHPSLLPSFPGLRAQKQALDWGVKVSGCTVHFVNETVDQGPIILQTAVPVYPEDTEESLSARILEQEHRILPQAIQYFAEGRLKVLGRRVVISSGKAGDRSETERRDEDRRIQELRRLVDETAEKLSSEELSWEDARRLIERTREQVLLLFPDKAEAFDLIYKPRFYRILDEKLHRI